MLRASVVLADDPGWIPSSPCGGSQPSVTPVAGDQTGMYNEHIHVWKQNIHKVKFINLTKFN